MSLLLALLACTSYRGYPLLRLDTGRPFEPTGIAILADGRVVLSAEGDATHLYVPEPDVAVKAATVLEFFPLRDERAACGDRPGCARRAYRADVPLVASPVRWDTRGGLPLPYNVEDLAPYGPDRVIGVTEYSTIGRRSGYRSDARPRSRAETERIFVLARTETGWDEVTTPEVARLRDQLSDWGRATCRDDMLVEGLARDPGSGRVWIGLRRCAGPSTRVLGYDLEAARQGRAVSLEDVARGVQGGAGPEEGISGLTFGEGRLWATTAWDSYGYPTEAVFGGRVHEVRDGTLVPVDLGEPFQDRPSALAVPPRRTPGGVDTVVLFDNDAASAQRARPNATLLSARLPRPADGAWAQLTEIAEAVVPPTALNGFDFRWYARDHRLSQLAAVLSVRGDGRPGAWTRAVGGLWQMQVGANLGAFSSLFPVFGRTLGHDKQAAAFTDLRGTGVRFEGYRARVSVVPRDRERENPSVARLLEQTREGYRVTAPLAHAASATAGLVLQGFEIDTGSRADRGICLAAIELGVDWHDPGRTAVDLVTTLIGGLCNDFDTRGEGLLHGRTTDAEGGVDVRVHFAVVEGAQAEPWSGRVYDRRVPGPPDARPSAARRAMDDDTAQAHLHCVRVLAEGGPAALPRAPAAPPASWLDLGVDADPVRPAVEAAALRGFALALDPAGFDPRLEQRALTENEALNRNHYIHRYLVRAFAERTGVFLEGGLSHGIHRRGPMRDNAQPSALLLGVGLTTFTGLAHPAVVHDIVVPRRRDDPNLSPEDGFIRWSSAIPRAEPARCSSPW